MLYDVQIAKAIYALKNKDFSSIRAAARFFEVNHTTLSVTADTFPGMAQGAIRKVYRIAT
jgi:hypothetical protein